MEMGIKSLGIFFREMKVYFNWDYSRLMKGIAGFWAWLEVAAYLASN